MPRPAFLHTSPVHVPVFDALLAERDPALSARHLVDEGLLTDARRYGPGAVADRTRRRLEELRDQGAQLICCTCSTIGDVAERTEVGIPVFRVDRPMVERSVALGPRIGVIAALTSTLEPTRTLIQQVAAGTGDDVAITLVTAEGAWETFERGEQGAYLDRIADAARSCAGSVDVLVLAQASMADATDLLADLPIPVLSSPGPAVDRLFG